MGGLKDQLLKSGLVNEKQLKKAQQEKRREDRQHQGQGKQGAEAEEQRRQREAAAAEKAERDRQLNLQRQQEAERKAVAAQVKQLVEAHRQPPGFGDTPFNFVDGGKVKRLAMSDAVRGQLTRGQLAIVKVENRYELVPGEIAEKIRQRDPEAVILHNAPPPRQPGAEGQGEDPYAGYQVPDDLMW